ncbi:MAG TPA: hypothetical protein PLL33_13005, partial [Paracoccus sp. (in: a-proteobacteria)]|nr:hypothetical protein [Paracoccus sp. (in: a-proteobacteria)]
MLTLFRREWVAPRLRRLAAGLALGLAVLSAPPAHAAPLGRDAVASVTAAAPTPAIAAALFGLPEGSAVTLDRQQAPVPGWRARAKGRDLGLIGSTWELAGSTGYSGRPLDVLVAVTPGGQIAGARLM